MRLVEVLRERMRPEEVVVKRENVGTRRTEKQGKEKGFWFC